MEESSSKFVDQFALGKLLNDKISQVKHSPFNSNFKAETGLFESLDRCVLNGAQSKSSPQFVELPSFVTSSGFPENDTIILYTHHAENPRGNVLFLHGLFDDNLINYDYQIRLLNNLGLNFYLMTLPYHYKRKPAQSLFSGEYFMSGDVYRAQNAYKQAIFDCEASLQWIKSENSLPVLLAGFSMGGNIVFRYYLLKKQALKAFLINPVTDLSGVIWDNPLFVNVGEELKKSGFDIGLTRNLFKEMDPCENLGALDADRVAMVYSNYDQIIDTRQYLEFIRKTGIGQVVDYNCGHLNVLRVPRLAKDIADFFEKTDKKEEKIL